MTSATTSRPDGTGGTPAPDLDAEYRQAREECALHAPVDRAWLRVTGADAAEFLQGQVTNDTVALQPGHGCHALLLNRKGRVEADLRILRLSDEESLVEADAGSLARMRRHLDRYRIGHRVELEEANRELLVLIGPGTPAVLDAAAGPEHSFSTLRIAGAGPLVVATASGADLICEAASAPAIREELIARGVVPISPDAIEILRVEAGRPRLGAEIGETTMPAEAGLVESTVSFDKGCYIGQEPVIRLHYRGRANRHLRGLRFTAPAGRGDPVRLDGKEIGAVGTAVVSPAFGRIGLAVLRREAEPGDTVTVAAEAGESDAEVVRLPFRELGP